jgi:hypothetical protein
VLWIAAIIALAMDTQIAVSSLDFAYCSLQSGRAVAIATAANLCDGRREMQSRDTVLAQLFKWLAGYCRHKHYTFPMTLRPTEAGSDLRAPAETYVVCLGCARKFPYDWNQMRVVWTPLHGGTQLSSAPEMSPSRATVPNLLFRFWYSLRKVKAHTA